MQNSTFNSLPDQNTKQTNKKAIKIENKEDFVKKPDHMGWPTMTDKTLGFSNHPSCSLVGL